MCFSILWAAQGDELESQALAPKDVEDSRTTEAKSRAVVLEMIGDLPEAEAKPPSDMLFVCKLNPVTSEEVRWDGPCHRRLDPAACWHLGACSCRCVWHQAAPFMPPAPWS